jgi:hypothetical protein
MKIARTTALPPRCFFTTSPIANFDIYKPCSLIVVRLNTAEVSEEFMNESLTTVVPSRTCEQETVVDYDSRFRPLKNRTLGVVTHRLMSETYSQY